MGGPPVGRCDRAWVGPQPAPLPPGSGLGREQVFVGREAAGKCMGLGAAAVERCAVVGGGQDDFEPGGIGLETMDTAAACRTYNVLASEGRKVAALLLLESASLIT